MSALAFKGTSIDQDPRWAKARAKRKKEMKFPAIFATKVDMSKINRDQFKKWTEKRLLELFNGLEDEILINYVHGYLEQTEVDPEDMLMSLNDMLERDTFTFMEELWTLLVDAQKYTSGIPKAFVDATKANVDARMQERDRIAHGMRHSGHSNQFLKHHLPEDLHHDYSPRHSHHSRDNHPSDRYGLDIPHQRPPVTDSRDFTEKDSFRSHPRSSDHYRERDRLDRPERSHSPPYRREFDGEAPISAHKPNVRDDDGFHPPNERRHYRDRRYDDRRHRDGRSRHFDRRRDERNWDDDHAPHRRGDREHVKVEEGEVDIFGRDARPAPKNGSARDENFERQSASPGRHSQDRSPTFAEEYTSSNHQSKKRHHEAGSDEDGEPERSPKRAKRSY